ncbi:MAG: TonB-dependent receptor plug domain-containing protein [Burkholderiaceae bacterium]
MKTNLAVSVALLASALHGAAAQTTQSTSSTSHTPLLERVIVSSSRTAAPDAEIGSAISVITAEELERRQIRFVSDALRAVPGIAVNRQGPAGTATQIRIRGAEANHTVVLIDGVKINDPFTSEVDFAHLLSAEIERIEVLRGPQSVLYGSEAIGGVISIFTKRGTRGVQIEGAAEAGSFRTFDGSAALRGTGETISYALSAAGVKTDGTNVSRFGSEDDGYRNQTFHARAGWIPISNVAFDATLRHRDSRSEFDPQDFGFPPSPTFGLIIDGDRKTEGEQFDAGLRGRLRTGVLEHQLGVARTKTEEDTFADGVFSNSFAGLRTRFDYQGTWRFGADAFAQALTLAAEHEKQRFESTGPTPASAQNQMQRNDKTGFAAEYRARLPTSTALTLSARRDNHELFDDATTYRVTAAQPLGRRWKLRGSYGTAIANPTFFELFGFIPDSFDPNPQLKPEKSRGFDLGADFALDTGRLSITYFDADLRNEIVGTFNAATFRSSVANLPGESKRRGVEVEAHYSPRDNVDVAVSYTYADAKQPDDQREVRRPRHTAFAAINYSFAGARGAVTLAADYNGRQQDLDFRTFTAARVTLRDYTLVRIAGSYALTQNFSVIARIENLLDRDYEEVFSYRPSGRAFYAGVRANF